MLDAGQYSVTVTLIGFREGTASVTIPVGGTVVLDFPLVRAAPGSITGTVTDDGGNPLVRATVAIVGSISTRTDTNGRYILANLFPRSYEVKASAGGRFIPETDTVTVNEGQATELDFALVLRKP